MKQNITWIVVVGIVIALMSWAWLSGEHQFATASGPENYDDDCCGQGPGIAEVRKVPVPPLAYISVSDESEEAWTTLRQIERELHEKTWKLSLLHSEGASPELIEAMELELKALTEDYHEQREALTEHTILPAGMYGGL